MKIRLEKFLSHEKLGTRNEVKKIIKKGFIYINGKMEKDFSKKINPLIDKVFLNNVEIKYHEFKYIILNKPKNYVCANNDNMNLTVFDLIDDIAPNLHIVGRLDKDTTGLVLITNNGNWSHQLKSPKSNTEKEYEVTLKKPLTDLMIQKIENGLILDNKKLKPIKILKKAKNKCNVILIEGKYHQIKRIFNMVDNEVIELNRIRIGDYKLYDLELGKWKEIYIKLDNK